MVSFWQKQFLSWFKNVDIHNPNRLELERPLRIERFVTLKGGSRQGAFLRIGSGTWIREGAFVSASAGVLEIGHHCLLAQRAWLGGRGEIIISDNVLIGPNVVIVSSNHDMNNGRLPALCLSEFSGRVVIGRSSWIGANSVILPDVEIGDNCIVGAGSVVTRSIPSRTCVAGNPAQPIREVGLMHR